MFTSLIFRGLLLLLIAQKYTFFPQSGDMSVATLSQDDGKNITTTTKICVNGTCTERKTISPSKSTQSIASGPANGTSLSSNEPCGSPSKSMTGTSEPISQINGPALSTNTKSTNSLTTPSPSAVSEIGCPPLSPSTKSTSSLTTPSPCTISTTDGGKTTGGENTNGGITPGCGNTKDGNTTGNGSTADTTGCGGTDPTNDQSESSPTGQEYPDITVDGSETDHQMNCM